MARDWFYPERVPCSFFDFAPSRVDRRQDAINLVALWQFRDANLTQALVSTAHLTDAILHDQAGRRDNLSSAALRSIYAMAFCRFVNALVDRDVRKSTTTTIAKDKVVTDSGAGSGPHRGQSSMYAHALDLGLPETFVELRHQAIHEEVPSLEVLRVRTGEALEWLWERWWKFNVKGSAEPALSDWEKKHGKWHAGSSQVGAEEERFRADESALCQMCRKRKRSNLEEGDEDRSDLREESREDADNIDTPKQKQQQGWEMHFSGGLPQWREGLDMH
jgi:Las1-like